LTSSSWPAAACRLIRGMIAVRIDTPTIPYGNWNSIEAKA